MLHGAGASADSFAALGLRLAADFHVIAPDLPGHGATKLGRRNRSGLTEMATDIAGLCAQLNFQPTAIIGHSAGGALSIALTTHLSPRGQILINPALTGFSGAAALLFPLLAKTLTLVPFTPAILSRNISAPERMSQLLVRTGSAISPEMLERYRSLASNPKHIDGTLRMMAEWDLSEIADAQLGSETTVVLGQGDGTVNPLETRRLLAHSNCNIIDADGGHLLHEERPDLLTDIAFKSLEKLGVPAGTH